LEEANPDAFVRYMNIRYGEIGTTDVGPIPAPSPAPPGPELCGSNSNCACSPGMQNHGTSMQDNFVWARDESQCCDLCSQLEGCAGWTFVPGNGQCWLKDTVGEMTPDKWVISGSVTAVTGPSPSPPSSSCPGGSLSTCLGLCPSDAGAFETCVKECMSRCHDGSMEIGALV